MNGQHLLKHHDSQQYSNAHQDTWVRWREGMAVPSTSGFILEDDPLTPKSNAIVPFRELIPHADHPKIAGISSHDARSWCESRKQIAGPVWLIERLDERNLERPYKGFTTDGVVLQDVYQYDDDEGAPVEEIVRAAELLLQILSPVQRAEVSKKSVDEDEFRIWSNPELYVNPGGLRLDECTHAVQDAVHALLRTATSPEGYAKVHGCMLTNGFLGSLVHGEAVLNEHSYNFRLFGAPHRTAPWGFTFFGHHLALALLVHGRRMVAAPTFLGAEPDRIDAGPHAGLRLFHDEEIGGLDLMRALPPALQAKAQLNTGLGGADLPAGRWNPFDERHLGGVRQDNRIVPYEGCPVALFGAAQKAAVLRLLECFNLCLPAGPRAARMRLLERHLDATYFAWIGGFAPDDIYYYRIHSPVTFCEFDFHCGSERV